MLRRCITPAQVRRCLKTLPKTLYSTYERILAEIDKEHIDMVITALKWLVIAERPLTLHELAEAVALGLEPRADFDIDNRLPDLTDIIRVLGSLVAVEVPLTRRFYWLHPEYDSDSDSEFCVNSVCHASDAVTTGNSDSPYYSPIVRLAHFSVREYLMSTLPKPWSTDHFNEADLHDFAAIACLNYIKLIMSHNSMFGDLYYYALSYWFMHAKNCKDHNRANSAKFFTFLSEFRLTAERPLERLLSLHI
ncbi:P-loop containing nucleoside triphosphate hydrolase protein [Rutstroemia sp. NJR-2017a BBW]|nr:P-loop containing nucleoside triphosphate hydrolase protein [Rutstroemia sp. NJR-2017a BBW]